MGSSLFLRSGEFRRYTIPMSVEARRPKVFILGISGFLGHNLALRLRDEFLISGCCFSHFTTIPGAQTFPVDLTKIDILEAILRVQAPDFVVNCMGVADRAVVEAMPKVTDSLNLLLPVSYAVLANKMKAQFIQISTADVFDGEEGPYNEENYHFTMHDPFGKQKLAAESYIRAQTLESNILRVGRVMGMGSPYRPTEFDKQRIKLAHKKNVTASAQRIYSYLSIHSFCEAIRAILHSKFPGKHRTFHVGGANISEFDFYSGWAELAIGNANLIKPPQEESEKNVGLVSDHFARNFPTWKPESGAMLLMNLLKDLSPGIGARKWQKTLQIP